MVFIALSSYHLLYTTLFPCETWLVCVRLLWLSAAFAIVVCHSNYNYTCMPSGQGLSAKNALQIMCYCFLNSSLQSTLRISVLLNSKCILSPLVCKVDWCFNTKILGVELEERQKNDLLIIDISLSSMIYLNLTEPRLFNLGLSFAPSALHASLGESYWKCYSLVTPVLEEILPSEISAV